jgi:signal transduction histidine kinase
MTRILVIEDEIFLLEEVLEWLRFEGYDVIGAEDGREGVNRALDSHPDLIFSDVMMPRLDGYHVLVELRTHPETALIPFIFLTAKADRRDMRNGMQLGADDYITKPFTREDLLDAVKSRIRKQEMQREAFLQDVAELRLALTRTLPHELRTPLMGVLGYSELLKMDANILNPEEISTIADHIMGGGQRLYRLIENYLLYAQLELSSRDSHTTEVIRKITTSTPDIVIAQAAITLATQYDRSGDLSIQSAIAQVSITETELTKIVMELVDNAFKFSEPGTVVQVSAAQEGSFYEIKISDQGRGMSAKEIGRIAAFNQFNRAIYEQQGSGMGLVIAKRLVELFGGSLVIYSAPERHHTTVCVRLAIANES